MLNVAPSVPRTHENLKFSCPIHNWGLTLAPDYDNLRMFCVARTSHPSGITEQCLQAGEYTTQTLSPFVGRCVKANPVGPGLTTPAQRPTEGLSRFVYREWSGLQPQNHPLTLKELAL
jgi:hypothetical protein